MTDVSQTMALRSVVQDAIDQGRIGFPRFLRCMARAEGGDRLAPLLEELVSLGDGWFGSPSTHRYRLGEDGGAYLTELIKWPDGQSAVVTVSLASSSGAQSLDLMLVGSRGTLYHDDLYPSQSGHGEGGR